MHLKKILTYFITVSFILSNSVGLILVYQQIKFYHKSAIKEQIKQNNFQQIVEVLSFSKNDLINKIIVLDFNEKHEFRYNGKLYDIINHWETEDSIFYKCINDTKEKELETIFIEYVVNNNHRQDLPLPIKQLLNSLQIEFYLVNGSIELLNFNSSTIFSNYVENPLDVFLFPPDHPPRLIT